MTTFTERIEAGASAADLAAHLDELPAVARVEQCLSVPGRLLHVLYDRVRGHGALELDAFVHPPEQTVVYELKNSLPAFNVAQKRFWRPTRGEVVGYNHTGSVAAWLAGPGYFFAIQGDDGELVFDYTRLPTFRPPGWPPIAPNNGIVSGLTYGSMLDYVRKVSAHTAVGAAFRGGKPRNAHFLLTRSAAQSSQS